MMPPIQQLIDEYDQAVKSNDDRATAETAYAIAIRSRDSGDHRTAVRYAQASLAAAERLPTEKLDDVASTRTEIGGVPLPDYFHDNVIRSRLGTLLT